VGFIPKDVEFVGGVRNIGEAELLEGSILDIPMNLRAVITEVKAVTTFKDLPLADRDRAWDASAAKARVATWAGADDGLATAEIQRMYRDCFFWYDAESPELFASYKLPFTDVIDGRLTAIPRAIFAAAGAMQGARGGVDIPADERAGVISHIERYYDKMGLESPFSEERAFRVDDATVFDERTLEKLLSSGVRFSNKEAKTLASVLKTLRDGDGDGHRDGEPTEAEWKAVVDELKKITQEVEHA
jgi:hypothetical protein